MKTIFVITTNLSVCHGHGDYGKETALAMKGAWGVDGFHPAFTSMEAAQKWIDSQEYKYGLHITELQVKE